MADLDNSVGSLTWVVEIIAMISFKIKYRGETRIKTKAGRYYSVYQNVLSREAKTRAQGNILQASEQIKQGEVVGYSQSLQSKAPENRHRGIKGIHDITSG